MDPEYFQCREKWYKTYGDTSEHPQTRGVVGVWVGKRDGDAVGCVMWGKLNRSV